jgi:hypothetical protein
MFKLLMASLFVLSVASPVQYPQYVTKGGHMFCRLRTDWDKGLDIVAFRDQVDLRRHVQTSTCGITRAGERVYKDNARGIGVIKIRPVGQETWFFTFTEAVRHL